jgi:hypothetical protein
MKFSPSKNELLNNYAVVARPQPLLACARRYSGNCGGNATDGRRAGLMPVNRTKNPAARPGFGFVEAGA